MFNLAGLLCLQNFLKQQQLHCKSFILLTHLHLPFLFLKTIMSLDHKKTKSIHPTKTMKLPLSRYQKFVIAMLAVLQFFVVLDFMVISPLGVIIMPDLKINSGAFGVIVSSYAFSAAAASIFAASFADRFDRKRLLLFFYTGFLIGTLFCGLAWNYPFLIFARAFTGFFGGVIGSVVLSIVSDLFEYEKRGVAMGFVQSAFASSQIFGIPIGIALAQIWGWRMAFILIAGLGTLIGIWILFFLKPVREHLASKKTTHPFRNILQILGNKDYLFSFLTIALLITGGFMIMPFSSAFNVHNVGIPLENLGYVYLFSGLASLLAGPIIGRLSDTYGKFPLFLFGAILTILAVLIYTHLRQTSLVLLILITVVLFIGVTARMVTSQAITSGVPSPQNRGAFMSINASVQMLSGGLASVLSGYLVTISPTGSVENFPLVGYFVSATALITVYFMHKIQKQVNLRQAKSTKDVVKESVSISH